jgi:hypothetical protein
VQTTGGGKGGAAVVTGARSNDALTAVFALSVTVHCTFVVAAAQASPQPAKTEPGDGVAVSVTEAPAGNVAAQEVPQETPSGELATEPEPPPCSATDSVGGDAAGGGVPPPLPPPPPPPPLAAAAT